MKKRIHKNALAEEYAKKLKDPRWQKKRLEVFSRDSFKCQNCRRDNITLNVHHIVYRSKNPWESEIEDLVTLCEECHHEETYDRKETEKSLIENLKKLGFFQDELEYLERITNCLCEYNSSLRSESWRIKEKELLERFASIPEKYKCIVCGLSENLTIYHKQYASRGFWAPEPCNLTDNAFDLICRSCIRHEFHDVLGSGFAMLRELRAAGFIGADLNQICKGIEELKFGISPYDLSSVFRMICNYPKLQLQLYSFLNRAFEVTEKSE